jgi:NDP-sugar pyrophosphorylase family protein
MVVVGGGDAPRQDRPGQMGGVPFAYLDVLGATVLERVVQQLRRAGISDISLSSSAGHESQTYLERAASRAEVEASSVPWSGFAPAADAIFERFHAAGADLVLVVCIGPYLDLDYEELIQHHIDKHCRMSAVVNPDGNLLGTFVLDASRRSDAACLFHSGLQQVRDDCERYVTNGYVNQLQSSGDFRRLGLDGLLNKNALQPAGTELKPGVWVGEGSRIHRQARVVAPAFLGAYSKIRASALVTRGSIVEHHAEIDCGTVVENSTVLPFTYVGAGLDVMHSVVGFRRLWHQVRNVEVEISDAKLVGMSVSGALSRTLGSAAALFTLLPKEIYRGFIGRSRKHRPAKLPESLEAPAAALEAPDVEQDPASGQEVPELDFRFAVVRRYGEH